MDILNYNRSAWNNYVDKQDRWTIPVTDEDIEHPKNGIWNIILTASKPVPHDWFPPLIGLKILGLASGGGLQGPILASLGAKVTIFDNSDKQLFQDKKISDRFNLGIQTFQGDMRDLAMFSDNSFDLIFNPCSILFIDNVATVWKECYRVLKPKGILMAGLINPITFQVDENAEKIAFIHNQPYSDLYSLTKEKLEKLTSNNEPLVFGHSWTDQIGGQLEAGFKLTDMYEDNWKGENPLDGFLPSFMATRAIK